MPKKQTKNTRKTGRLSVTLKKRVSASVAFKELVVAPRLLSYEEAMLRGILENDKKSRTTEYALLFNSVLSNLTKNMQDLYYKFGVSVGRALYRIHETKKRYVWYEDSVADLVSFFEEAGYRSITYNIFPDQVRTNLHDRSHVFLGSNLHVFEAGIMSGFLTAAKGQLVFMDEVSCTHNNKDYCQFLSFNLPQTSNRQTTGKETINKLIEYISNSAKTEHRMEMASEYHMLSALMILDREYLNHIEKIMTYLGAEFGKKLKISKNRKIDINKLEGIIKILNLGRPKVSSIKPLNIRIYFDKVNAKREFVDLSIAFLNGVISDIVDPAKKVDVFGVNKSDGYEVDLVEK